MSLTLSLTRTNFPAVPGLIFLDPHPDLLQPCTTMRAFVPDKNILSIALLTQEVTAGRGEGQRQPVSLRHTNSSHVPLFFWAG